MNEMLLLDLYCFVRWIFIWLWYFFLFFYRPIRHVLEISWVQARIVLKIGTCKKNFFYTLWQVHVLPFRFFYFLRAARIEYTFFLFFNSKKIKEIWVIWTFNRYLIFFYSLWIFCFSRLFLLFFARRVSKVWRN